MRSMIHTGGLVVGAVLIILVMHVMWFIYTPISPGRPIRIDITFGTSAWRISKTLAKEHVITDAPAFMTIALLTRRARNLQAGTYVFEGRHYPIEVMDILYQGKSLRYKITIPEGSDIIAIGDILTTTGMFSRREFIKTAQKRSTAEFFSLNAPSMEGFLFPDTYYLGPNMTAMEIISRMVARYRKVYTSDMQARARRIGLSDLEVITLASMIEKEARSTVEKPIISSVFHNRLKLRMPLQSDPTAVYGLEGFRRTITPGDLRRKSPYNTYLNKGLPPGPICNPGKDAILAALWPAKTSHLYFVSKGNGYHYFSSSFKEHNAAIARARISSRK
ncbi:MAG: endolytic transglycosylase MltG [Syntrophaceae bacterium]